ncbi:alpha/beta hydrolase [Spongiactinospora rosea]|uniref:alpha/beta hydrolase n=1 Tax=Spongiactinospora rosea TaxID=2248750 RepID=UPI0013149368|nr:alpha/beta hydrolase [Spongiactinospora rosea]
MLRRLTASALLLAALAVPASATASASPIEWGPCKGLPQPVTGMECGKLTVPLDHADPRAGTIELPVARVKATGRRLGSLVMHFGGGGANGVASLAAQHTRFQALRAGYDLVAFDPRGTGTAAPLRCADGRSIGRLLDLDPGYDKTFLRETAAFVRGCVKGARIVGHAGSGDTARDMDRLRAALGEDRLDYYGVSYGSVVGGVYATLFPGRVGRVVLDAGLDPGLDSLRTESQVATSMQRSYERFLADCVRRGCALGKDVKAANGAVERLLKRLERAPLPVGDRRLGRGQATNALMLTSSLPLWPELEARLARAVQGDGKPLLEAADLLTQARPDGTYGMEEITASSMLAYCHDKRRSSWREIRRDEVRMKRTSPIFGPSAVAGRFLGPACNFWPVPDRPEGRTVAHTGKTPIVVVGSKNDLAAPLTGAAALAGKLRTGVLISYQGDLHGAYPDGGSCVAGPVEGYLLRGIVPGQGITCPAVP